MKSLIIAGLNSTKAELLEALESKCKAEIIRFDLAWTLFLGKNGTNEKGELDIPEGNPRTKWFSLNQWTHQTLGSYVHMADGQEKEKNIIAIMSSCTSAALEYAKRSLSLYSNSLGLIDADEFANSLLIAEHACQYFTQGITEYINNAWTPPVINYLNKPTPLLQKTKKVQNDGVFTWLAGILGSNQVFAQYYRLHPHAKGNRIHSHSDIYELYVVLEGNGTLRTNRCDFPVKHGDIVAKPGGSGLATQFIAGEQGMVILDIEIWRHADQTDVVYYPDHQEIFLRGKGLNLTAPKDSFFSGDEMMKHYSQSYRRGKNGEMIIE